MTSTGELATILCEGLDDHDRELLREDPFEAIPLVEPAVTIRIVESGEASGCSVEGLYHEETRLITVQRALSRRRTNFTALDEFGHHRARHHPHVARVLANMPTDAGRRLEERVADSFAARVLVPDSAVEDVLEGRAPSAHDVAALFRHMDVGGSREACCVRIAHQMTGAGYVLLCEAGAIRFCATVGSAYTVRRGTQQGGDHLVSRAQTSGSARSDHVRLRHPSGGETPEFSGQAVREGAYVFAVLTDATSPPWGGWMPPRGSSARMPNAPEIYCADCREISEAWQRCDTDAGHRVCSTCGWCECRTPKTKIAEKQCDTCFTTKRIDLFPDDGPTCIDHS